MNVHKKLLVFGLTVGIISGCANAESDSASGEPPVKVIENPLQKVLDEAKRIPTSDGWFEVLKLPNDVYAFYEPGHIERVNSFLILGDKQDLLYDTGMGIASIKTALAEVRKAESLPERELIVLNSHGHLDHIGGNYEFDKIIAYNSEWRTRKLTDGIPAGSPIWIEYYSAVTPPPQAPASFSPETMSVRPVEKNKISYIEDGHVFDLGNRQFKAILSLSHTDDSVVLYDAENKLLFTGDVFHPQGFYVLDFDELSKDLKMLAALDVAYHYNTHGLQLAGLDRRGIAVRAMTKIENGEVEAGEREFLGAKRKFYVVDDIEFLYMPELMMY